MTTTPNAIKELARQKQWVNWRSEFTDDGKPTKRPYNARTGNFATSIHPATWSTLDEVRKATGYDGVGSVFTAKDPYTGIDLDHCVVNGKLEPWALDIIERMASYTEWSPSGTGVHIWVRGVLPTNAYHKVKNIPGATHMDAAIEMYDRGRYFTVTGKVVTGCIDTIEDRQEQVDQLQELMGSIKGEQLKAIQPRNIPTVTTSLSDKELLEKASNASNGAAFDALWRGDTSAYSGDESAADLALCNMLAFWFGCDAYRMDTNFRNSGLLRDKWDEKHCDDGRTYGQMTIDLAIKGCSAVYDPSKPKPGNTVTPIPATIDTDTVAECMATDTEADRLKSIPLNELYANADKAGEIQWIVPNGIALGYVHLLSAPPKSGKTWFGLTLARSVCRGEAWAGAEGVQQGAVLWIDEEMGQPLLARRLRQLEFKPELPFYTLSLAGFRLDQGGDVAKVMQEAKERNAALIVVDSLRRVHKLKENDNDEIKLLMPMLKALASTGAAVVVLHHDRKRSQNEGGDEQERSSGALDLIALVDMVYGMSRNRNTYTLKCRSARLVGEEQATSIAFKLIDREDGCIEVEPLDSLQQQAEKHEELDKRICIYLEAKPNSNTRTICEAIGGRANEVTAALKSMTETGKIIQMPGPHRSKLYSVAYALSGDSEPEYEDA